MVVVHLLASPFFGGPERQMLGLARALPADYRSVFLTFAEKGKSQALLEQVRRHGFEGLALVHNTPRFRLAAAEIAQQLRRLQADILVCSGYKPDILGWLAARQVGLPVISVSHGWTAATWRVRCNEFLDRLVLHGMDAVVCVSEAQADRVRRAMVPEKRIVVIRNAIDHEAFAPRDPAYGPRLHEFFADPPEKIVGGIGRLSPEKGFDQLVTAAAQVVRDDPKVGFVLFGDGPLHADLTRQIEALGLAGRCVLAGFRDDVTRFLPHLDLVVLPSHTEGLPVVVLEAQAAGVPVVATAVGGTPEAIADGITGFLVPPRDIDSLARRIREVLADDRRRREMGQAGRQRMADEFTFAAQSGEYQQLFQRLVRGPVPACP